MSRFEYHEFEIQYLSDDDKGPALHLAELTLLLMLHNGGLELAAAKFASSLDLWVLRRMS